MLQCLDLESRPDWINPTQRKSLFKTTRTLHLSLVFLLLILQSRADSGEQLKVRAGTLYVWTEGSELSLKQIQRISEMVESSYRDIGIEFKEVKISGSPPIDRDTKPLDQIVRLTDQVGHVELMGPSKTQTYISPAGQKGNMLDHYKNTLKLPLSDETVAGSLSLISPGHLIKTLEREHGRSFSDEERLRIVSQSIVHEIGHGFGLGHRHYSTPNSPYFMGSHDPRRNQSFSEFEATSMKLFISDIIERNPTKKQFVEILAKTLSEKNESKTKLFNRSVSEALGSCDPSYPFKPLLRTPEEALYRDHFGDLYRIDDVSSMRQAFVRAKELALKFCSKAEAFVINDDIIKEIDLAVNREIEAILDAKLDFLVQEVERVSKYRQPTGEIQTLNQYYSSVPPETQSKWAAKVERAKSVTSTNGSLRSRSCTKVDLRNTERGRKVFRKVPKLEPLDDSVAVIIADLLSYETDSDVSSAQISLILNSTRHKNGTPGEIKSSLRIADALNRAIGSKMCDEEDSLFAASDLPEVRSGSKARQDPCILSSQGKKVLEGNDLREISSKLETQTFQSIQREGGREPCKPLVGLGEYSVISLDHSPHPDYTSLRDPNGLVDLLDKALEKGRPAAMTYNTYDFNEKIPIAFYDSRDFPLTSPNSEERTATVVAREFDKKTGDCRFLIRSAFPIEEKVHSDKNDSEPGYRWVSESTLARSARGAHYIKSNR